MHLKIHVYKFLEIKPEYFKSEIKTFYMEGWNVIWRDKGWCWDEGRYDQWPWTTGEER